MKSLRIRCADESHFFGLPFSLVVPFSPFKSLDLSFSATIGPGRKQQIAVKCAELSLDIASPTI